MLPLLLSLLLHAAPGDAVLGTYRVQAIVRLTGVPVARSLEVRGDVELRAGATADAVRARLGARGHVCELDATLAAPGRVVFTAGQRCPIALEDPSLRGTVAATVRSGEVRIAADGHLVLALDAALAGSVRIETGIVPGLGREAAVPIDGSASVRGEGDRDNSRAADP